MIIVACARCSREYAVAEAYAGRRARCKGCGEVIRVPAVALPPMSAAAARNELPVRTRRLIADAGQIQRSFKGFEPISARPVGAAPSDLYEVEYHVRGIERLADDRPVFRDVHRVEVQLTSRYPELAPQCRMLTPIFHPNIDAASICIGDHWTAGQRISDLVVRIGEMIAYQAYNVKSPLNADAAMWADLHAQELPIDARNLTPPAMDACLKVSA